MFSSLDPKHIFDIVSSRFDGTIEDGHRMNFGFRFKFDDEPIPDAPAHLSDSSLFIDMYSPLNEDGSASINVSVGTNYCDSYVFPYTKHFTFDGNKAFSPDSCVSAKEVSLVLNALPHLFDSLPIIIYRLQELHSKLLGNEKFDPPVVS